MTFFYSDDFVQIDDRRRAQRTSFTFEGSLARLYKSACAERPVSVAKALESGGG